MQLFTFKVRGDRHQILLALSPLPQDAWRLDPMRLPQGTWSLDRAMLTIAAPYLLSFKEQLEKTVMGLKSTSLKGLLDVVGDCCATFEAMQECTPETEPKTVVAEDPIDRKLRAQRDENLRHAFGMDNESSLWDRVDLKESP